MAPKPDTAAGAAPLNEREQRVLISAIVHCTKAPVEIDYPKLATVLGLKDRNSSKATWHGLKKKLEAAAPKFPTGELLLPRSNGAGLSLSFLVFGDCHEKDFLLTCCSFGVVAADSEDGDDAGNGADADEGESGEKSPVKKGKEKKAKGEDILDLWYW